MAYVIRGGRVFAAACGRQMSAHALRGKLLSAQSLPSAPSPAVPGQPILAAVRADYAPLLHLRIMPHLGVWKLVAAVEKHPHAQPDEAECQEEDG